MRRLYNSVITLATLLIVAGGAVAEDFVTRSGKVYKGAVDVKVAGTGVRVVYDGGVANVNYEDLSDEQRRRFGLTKGAVDDARQRATDAALERKAKAAKVRAAKEEEIRLDKLPRYEVSGKVVRVITEDRLVLQTFRTKIPNDPLTRIGGGRRNAVTPAFREPREPFVLITVVPPSKNGYAEGQNVRFECIQRDTEKVGEMTLRIYQVRPEKKSR